MKDSLLLPVIFLVLLVVCSVLLGVGYLMYQWDVQYVPSTPPNLHWAVAAAPAALRTIFVPAALAAFFLVIMRVARRPGVPFFSLLFSLAMLFAGLHYGLIAVNHLQALQAGSVNRSYNPILAGRFNLLGGGIVYPQKVDGDALGPTLVVSPQAKLAFSVQQSGRYDQSGSKLIFGAGKLTLPVRPPNPNLSPVLAPRGFLSGFVSDIMALSAFLERWNRGSRVNFAIALGGVVLFSVGAIGFAWVTRWPLLNVFLVAVCFRLLFWLFTLFTNTVATDAFALVVPARYMPLAPSIGLGALGAIFLLWDIAFIRPPVRE